MAKKNIYFLIFALHWLLPKKRLQCQSLKSRYSHQDVKKFFIKVTQLIKSDSEFGTLRASVFTLLRYNFDFEFLVFH